MKKALFIDRDGTIIWEPPVTEQVDTLEQLVFMPAAIGSLARIAEGDFELVLASNQDGLGTDAYPREQFDIVHNKMLQLLAGEGVEFADQLIDVTYKSDNKPTRKPGTGMFGDYMMHIRNGKITGKLPKGYQDIEEVFEDEELIDHFIFSQRLTFMERKDRVLDPALLEQQMEHAQKI